MLPWNYGFHADAGHLVFLGAFYTVLTIVVVTVVNAALRSRRDLRTQRVEHIRWDVDFHGLPAGDRVCRHALTGELPGRECERAFDCRGCETHQKLIAVHPAACSGPAEIYGMEFPLDRYYHRGHTWARREADGTVTVGLDELGRRLLGAPEGVSLPAEGAHIEVNGTACRITKRGAEVRILSPIEGEVVETSGLEGEWILKVRPASESDAAFAHLLRGEEVAPWLTREMERLHIALVAEGAAPTLADGGVPVADIAACYPKADWDAVCGEMFLEG